jgi:alkaline phosphatase
VVTCEFPHATPADFSAHYYDRGNYNAIAPQIAYQNLDVMFGGGTGILTDDIKQHFADNGTTLIQDDKDALLNYQGNGKIWALFGKKALPYDIDRNPEKIPSLSEMTGKALEVLSKHENGFSLWSRAVRWIGPHTPTIRSPLLPNSLLLMKLWVK